MNSLLHDVEKYVDKLSVYKSWSGVWVSNEKFQVWLNDQQKTRKIGIVKGLIVFTFKNY